MRTTGRKRFWMGMIQTGILLITAGVLLFLFKIPWKWMQESSPLLMYGSQRTTQEGLISRVITQHIPLYTYAGCNYVTAISIQSKLTEEEVLLAQARDEDVFIEEQQLFNEGMEEENSAARGSEQNKEGNEAEETLGTDVQLPVALPMEKYSDFDMLLQDFYVVDKSTYITGEELNASKMLNYDLRLKDVKEGMDAEGPQVLIYHTHSQEGYADSDPGDKGTTVVGAGERLAQLLEEEYDIKVLHHTGEYDVESRDYAYANVEPQLEKLLAEYPTIEVVIDLHRDGVADDTRLVTEIDGKRTAQFMFFNGLSRLKSAGEIEYLKNENREGNLAFSFQLQVKCMEYYPGLARSIYLKGYRYNMQYKEKSLLVELGAQTNTVEEVWNALPPLAHVLSMVLKGE